MKTYHHQTYKIITMTIGILLFLALLASGQTQAICAHRIDVQLSGGIKVGLHPSYHNTSHQKTFYILPSHLKIAQKQGRKEVLFQTYEDEGTQGAIMHLMLQWGLNATQEAVLKQQLGESDTVKIKLKYLEVHPHSSGSFSISSSHALAQIMKRALGENKSQTPVQAGAKMALALHFKGKDAESIRLALSNPKKFKGVKFRLKYQYQGFSCVKGPNKGINPRPQLSYTLERDLSELFKNMNL